MDPTVPFNFKIALYGIDDATFQSQNAVPPHLDAAFWRFTAYGFRQSQNAVSAYLKIY